MSRSRLAPPPASDWRMRSARILAVAAILGVAAFMASLVLASRQAVVERTATEQATAQSYAVRKETLLLLSDLQDAETGQRGYLLVTQSAYLAPYQSGRAGALTRLDRLAELTRDNPARQRQIAELRTVVAAKLSELATTVDLAQSGDRVGAMNIVTSGRGKALMDQARTLLGDIRASEERQLTASTREAAEAARRERRLDYGLQVLGLLTLLAAAGLTFVMLRRAAQARVDEAIVASEERLRHALDAGRMVAWDVDFATGKTRASGNAVGILGRAIDDRGGFVALIHPEDRARVKALREAAIRDAAEYNVEFRILNDGRELWMATRAQIERNADGRAIRMVGITSDITALKASELAANVAAARFRHAVDAVDGILWTNNAAGEMQGEQPGWAALTGQALNEYQGFGWSAAVHPDDAQPTIDAWNAAVAECRPMVFEHRVKRHDGAWRLYSIRAVPTLNEEGAIVEWVGVHTDITEQREAEARQQLLLTLADRLRDLSEPLDIEAAATELLGRYLGVSRVGYGEISAGGAMVTLEACYADGVAPLVGTFPTEAYGRGNVAELRRGVTTILADVTADPRTSDADFAAIETRSAIGVPLIRGGQWRAVLYVNHRELRTWTPDEVSLVEAVAARAWDARERARAASELHEMNLALEQRVQAAVAERAEALARLHEAQKIETLGQLTGGVAHDFNNLLTPIMGGLDILSRKLAHDERAQRIAANAMQSAERAKTLVQRLLAFGRRQTLQSRPLDIAQLIEGMRDLIERSIGPSIQITVDIAAGLPAVEADPNQLELAILNLCVNARDAMESGGRLTIAAARVEPDNGSGKPECVAIRVSDTGMGMDEATLAKATEPFFTTKGVGQGTGLGLSMVYGLAAQSGGRLTLTSKVGEGTTAELVLPVSTEPAEVRLDADTPVIERGAGTVLLVDDEELVRMSIADGLRDLGFQVVEAASAAGALEHLREGLAPDVLVTDHMMPGMTGATLAREARNKIPDLPVLMITGYANLRPAETRGLEVMAKPFHRGDLAARIADMMKQSDATVVGGLHRQSEKVVD